jgi:hypothetical protein
LTEIYNRNEKVKDAEESFMIDSDTQQKKILATISSLQ